MSKLKKFLGLETLTVLMLGAPKIAHAQAAPVDWDELINPTQGLFGTLADSGTVVTRIIQILLLIAGLIALVYLIVGGYQYITAGGNAEQATAARTTILNAIIGLVIVFASYALLTWVLVKYIGY